MLPIRVVLGLIVGPPPCCVTLHLMFGLVTSSLASAFTMSRPSFFVRFLILALSLGLGTSPGLRRVLVSILVGIPVGPDHLQPRIPEDLGVEFGVAGTRFGYSLYLLISDVNRQCL